MGRAGRGKWDQMSWQESRAEIRQGRGTGDETGMLVPMEPGYGAYGTIPQRMLEAM